MFHSTLQVHAEEKDNIVGEPSSFTSNLGALALQISYPGTWPSQYSATHDDNANAVYFIYPSAPRPRDKYTGEDIILQ